MPRAKSDSFKRNVSFYNSEFDLVKEPVEGKITSAKTKAEAEALFGNDDEKITDALNSVLRTQQINAAVQAKTGGMEERYIMAFIKVYRMSAPFNTIEKESEQTKAIMDVVKTTPFLLDSLKSYCANRAASEAEGNDEAED